MAGAGLGVEPGLGEAGPEGGLGVELYCFIATEVGCFEVDEQW